MNNGIVYVATGETYVLECLFSAESVRKCHLDIPITLFTDDIGVKRYFSGKVIKIENDIHPLKNKVKFLCESPYDYTLFLDTDTQVRKPILEMFEWLDDCDLGLAHAPNVDRSRQPPQLISYVSDSYNTGVILYRKTEGFKKFHAKWLECILPQDESDMWPGHNCDQTVFNRLVRENYHLKYGIRLKVFPNKQYNVKTPMFSALEESGEMKNSKILHSHTLYRDRVRSSRRFRFIRRRVKRRLG